VQYQVAAVDMFHAFDINNLGQVVGEHRDTGTSRAALWSPATPNGMNGTTVLIPPVSPRHTGGIARAINDFGQVAGVSAEFTFGAVRESQRAFLWTPSEPNDPVGELTEIPLLPSGDFAIATGINSIGQVVGGVVYQDVSNTDEPFLWTPSQPNTATGVISDLGVPKFLRAEGINDYGQITLDYNFIWTPDSPNAASGHTVQFNIELAGGLSINNRGQILGYARVDQGPLHAMLWTPEGESGDTFIRVELGDLPGVNNIKQPADLNNLGHAVGSVITSEAPRRKAFIWTPENGMQNLNDLIDPQSGWFLTFAEGINDHGQIVGVGLFDADGPGGQEPIGSAVLLTPIPEPSSFALIVSALLLLGCFLRTSALSS